MLNQAQKNNFTNEVWSYYKDHKRDMAWRIPEADGSFNSYKILLSEVMLQQTQVSRAEPKYQQFLKRFPSFYLLAEARLGAVLEVWNGLGYNRRAKFLWQTAQQVVKDYEGQLPLTVPELVKMPGIGTNTAGAIVVYTLNIPTVFIETNVRTVYIHHFFKSTDVVSDVQIATLLRETMPSENPREWYWALMDYGTFLKKTYGNKNRQSMHYIPSPEFKGSVRQVRGAVLRELTSKTMTSAELESVIVDPRLRSILSTLETEGFVVRHDKRYSLA